MAPIFEYISERYHKPGMYNLDVLCEWQSMFQAAVRKLNAYQIATKVLEPPQPILEELQQGISRGWSYCWRSIKSDYQRTANCDIVADHVDINNSIKASNLNANVNKDLNISGKGTITARTVDINIGNSINQKGSLVTQGGNINTGDHKIEGEDAVLDLTNTQYKASGGVTVTDGATFKTDGSMITIEEDCKIYNSKVCAFGAQFKVTRDMDIFGSDVSFEHVTATFNNLNLAKDGTMNLENSKLNTANNALFNGKLNIRGISIVDSKNSIYVNGDVKVDGDGYLKMKAKNDFISSATSTMNAENGILDIEAKDGILDNNASGTIRDLRMKGNIQNLDQWMYENGRQSITDSLTLDVDHRNLDIYRNISKQYSLNLIAASIDVNANIESAKNIRLKTRCGSVKINQAKIIAYDVAIDSARDMIATASNAKQITYESKERYNQSM